MKTVRLDGYTDGSPELAARCQKLDAEQIAWLVGQTKDEEPLKYDGTFGSLLLIYETHEESRFQTFPRVSRTPIHYQLRTLRLAVGDRRMDKLNGIDFRRWYRQFRAPRTEEGSERITNAYQLIKRTKAVLTFGAELGIPDAIRLRQVLGFMNFEAPKSRVSAGAKIPQ